MADLRNNILELLDSRIKSYEKAGLSTTYKCVFAKILHYEFERLTQATPQRLAEKLLNHKSFLESLYPVNTRFVNMRKKILDLIQYAETICTTN